MPGIATGRSVTAPGEDPHMHGLSGLVKRLIRINTDITRAKRQRRVFSSAKVSQSS